MIRALFLSILAFIVNTTFCQSNLELAKKLADTYKKHDAVIKENTTTITFSFNKNTQSVEVLESSSMEILALKANSDIIRTEMYDDNSYISKARFLSGTMSSVCGDYQPGGVFHSDDKICSYRIYCKSQGDVNQFVIEKGYKDIRYFGKVRFTEHYPILKSTVRLILPDELAIELKEYNITSFNLTVTKKHNSGNNTTAVEYSCLNLPGHINEDNEPGYDFTYPYLLVIPKTYNYKNTNISIFATLNDFYKWCKNLTDKTNNETSKLKPFVEELIRDKKTDEEKVKAIYYWVQNNIRYIAFEEGLAGYVPENSEKVFTQKYGDCKGMANLLKTMLKIAGFDARLTWTGTQRLRNNLSTHTLSSCDHMVCSLFLKNRRYVLDATNTYAAFGNFPDNLSGCQILIEDGEHYIYDSIPMSKIAENTLQTTHKLSIANDVLSGNSTMCLSGEIKQSYLSEINNTRTDEREKFFQRMITRSNPKIVASNIATSDIQNREEPFKIKSDIVVKGNINQFDNELYVNPDPYNDFLDYTVTEDRLASLDLSEMQNRKTDITISLTNEYKISKLPEEQTLTNDLLSYKIKYVSENGTLHYTKEINVLKRIITKDRFLEWNSTLKKLKKACNQPIILKKNK